MCTRFEENERFGHALEPQRRAKLINEMRPGECEANLLPSARPASTRSEFRIFRSSFAEVPSREARPFQGAADDFADAAQ